jgi:hypothetical protein
MSSARSCAERISPGIFCPVPASATPVLKLPLRPSGTCPPLSFGPQRSASGLNASARPARAPGRPRPRKSHYGVAFLLLRACLETPAAADMRASGQERPRGARAHLAVLLRRQRQELTGCCPRLTPGRLPQAAPDSGLAQGQVKEERRGYPLVAASLPSPQAAEHVVDGPCCDAALDGGLFERCQCAGVDLEA